MREVTKLEVKRTTNGHKVWIITKSKDKDLIGKPTTSGAPYPAYMLPVGATFTSKLLLPKLPVPPQLKSSVETKTSKSKKMFVSFHGMRKRNRICRD